MSNYTELDFDINQKNSPWVKIFNFIPEGSTVLDIGCSSGNFGKALIGLKKCTVDGLDLDEHDVKRAAKVLRQASIANVETDDLSKILKGKKYDVVIMADVIEHLLDPAKALRKIAKVIKPDGFLAFSIPHMAHVSVRLKLLVGDFPYTETGLLDKTHLHFYDIDEVERVIEAAGYKIEQYDSTTVNYPRSMVRKQLEAVGLKAEERFFDILNDSNANIYQFVAKIVPSDKPIKTSHRNLAITRSPAEDVHLHLMNLEQEWRDREIEILRYQPSRRVGRLVRRAAKKVIKPPKKKS